MPQALIDYRIELLGDAFSNERRKDHPDYEICLRALDLRSTEIRDRIVSGRKSVNARVITILAEALGHCETSCGKAIIRRCMREARKGRWIEELQDDEDVEK